MKRLTITLYPITAAIVLLAVNYKFTPTDWAVVFRTVVFIILAPAVLKYVTYLVLATGYRRHHPESAGSVTARPRISVLIPAWNEEVGIAATIRSVQATDYPDLEIIVINDGSTDTTDAVVRTLMARQEADPDGTSAPIRYRAQRNGGKARALNAGLATATGDIVVTIDADSVMDPRFLDEMARYFDRHDVAAVAGNVTIGNRDRPITLVQQLEYLYGFFFKRAEAIMGAVYIVGGAAAAYRRNVILDLGGFDEGIITEDIELSTRLHRYGHRVGYAADAIVHTEGPSDLSEICRQRLRWKYGRLQTFGKHRSLFFSRNPAHGKFLSFLVLPTALYSEILLFFEPILLPVFFAYTILTSDFVPVAAFIAILTSVIWFQVWSDPQRGNHRNLLTLAPVGWTLFYWLDVVEYQALVRSILRLAAGREVYWQRWQRRGVCAETVP